MLGHRIQHYQNQIRCEIKSMKLLFEDSIWIRADILDRRNIYSARSYCRILCWERIHFYSAIRVPTGGRGEQFPGAELFWGRHFWWKEGIANGLYHHLVVVVVVGGRHFPMSGPWVHSMKLGSIFKKFFSAWHSAKFPCVETTVVFVKQNRCS